MHCRNSEDNKQLQDNKMGQIKVEKNVGGIEGLCIIEPTVHGDNRGYFMETYNSKDMQEAGIDRVFVQDNQSCSTKGVLRGLHFQKEFPQAKLVRAVKGSVFDVAVDLRSDSKTYGKWYGVELTEENKKQFLIPRILYKKVIGDPAQTTELIVEVLILIEQGRPLGGIGDGVDAHLGEVADDGLHDLLVATLRI